MLVKDKTVEIKTPKAVDRSFVKDPCEKMARHRLRVLELAEKLGSVTQACRMSGMDRTSFYEWKRRYQTHGMEGLLDMPPVPKKHHPRETPDHVVEAVLELSAANPAWGSKRLEDELCAQGIVLSNFTVQKILKKQKLGTRFQRFLALETMLLAGEEMPEDLLLTLEKLNPSLKERHVESSAPGELVSFDTFYVGSFKGIGRVYLFTAVDTFGSYAFALLACSKQAVHAAELLYGQVLPFYEAHSLKLGAVLTDNGTEFCGREDHPFEALLFTAEVEHRRTRVKRPQTNGFVERFHRTILEEFFRVELRKRVFSRLEELETALQEWICHYNVKRPHQGYRNLGRPPYTVVTDTLNASQDA